MSVHALLFEAKSIQRRLTHSGRLRDVSGASEQVDSYTTGLVEAAPRSLGLKEGRDLRFSRRRGGVFYALSDDADVPARPAALWTLLVQQYASGFGLRVMRPACARPCPSPPQWWSAVAARASPFRRTPA